MSPRYRPAGLVLVRASTHPGGLDPLPDWDLADSAATLRHGTVWLAARWSRRELREAVTLASPDLAARVDQLLGTGVSELSAVAVRRAVLATASYLVRWERRCTPFGRFAGVAAASVGPAAAEFGDRHQAVVRADADWLAQVVERLEQCRDLRRRLMVVANSGGFVRDGRVIVAGRPEPDQHTPGPVRETSTRYTRAVELALRYAADPVPFNLLAGRLAAERGQVSDGKVEAMLHTLVDGHVLITSLRPPMTVVDGLAHVVEVLHAADGRSVPEVAALVDRLDQIHTDLARHNSIADSREQASIRIAAAESMATVLPGGHPLAVDVRLDAEISIPRSVLDEAADAAELLLRLSREPFGVTVWMDYQTRFRERYGPGALVPVRELVADSGLGYPSGFLGAPRARPAWRTLTERDAYLLALIQQASLDGAGEIRLSAADIEALTVGDHTAVVPPPRIELGVAVYADSTEALDRGDFQLQITGAPRAYTSMAGRFAHLLDPADRKQLLATYATAGGPHDGGVVAVQMSFPPRRVHNENVVRTGRLLPDVVSLSEHPTGDVISIDDLAVTCDADQLYLVRLSTGQRVIPHVPHALDVTVQTPPLARFIAEVADARSAVFGPLDLGVAGRTLPYIPRIRHRRTVLAPARWLLSADALNLTGGMSNGQWAEAIQGWRQRWRVPARVIVCHGELRLPLDLDHSVDRALLQTRLTRAERLELREDAPADVHGWLGRPAELLIPMTLSTPTVRRLPVTTPPGDTFFPGQSTIVHAQLVGNPARFDRLLTAHLAPSLASLGKLRVRWWWLRRHRDLIRLDAEQHLAVFLRLNDPGEFGAVAARLGQLADQLHRRGLPGQLTFAAYHPHPARYGHGPALDAAEQVFAADTTAAIAQLHTAEQAGIPAQALAAASMAQLAAGFAPDPATGYRALLDCLQQHTTPTDRALSNLARDLADPTGELATLRALPGGDTVAAAWRLRHTILREYHDRLAVQRDPGGVLRTLLHEHHVRAVGVDPDFERKTNRLARAAAMRCLAQTVSR